MEELSTKNGRRNMKHLSFTFGAAALVVTLAIGAAAAQGLEVMKTLLPAPAEVQGWKADGLPGIYNPETLWEYIDGAAETFLAYGFHGAIVQNYVSAADKGLKVEIYDQGNPLLAFGIFSQFRSPGVKVYDIGAEAFGDEYSVSFRKDRYYVRVAVFEKTPDLHAQAEKIAGIIAGKIATVGTPLPEDLCVLPNESLEPLSVKYIPENVLGYAQLPPAFVGTYTFKDEVEGKMYLSTLADSDSARKMFDWYSTKLGAVSKPTEGDYGSYVRSAGNDPFQGDVTTFQFGKWVGVITGLKAGSAETDKLVSDTIKRLSQVK
jgi:hypothetical protein